MYNNMFSNWIPLSDEKNDKTFINLLCENKNIAKFLVTVPHILSMAKLNEITQKYYNLSFLEYAYMAGNINIITHLSYKVQADIDIPNHITSIMSMSPDDREKFLSFYNDLPNNNLFDSYLYANPDKVLLLITESVHKSLSNNNINHCVITTNYGTQYNPEIIKSQDMFFKFLLKSKAITLNFFDNIEGPKDERNNQHPLFYFPISHEVNYRLYKYALFKNYTSTVEYIIHTYPEHKQMIMSKLKHIIVFDYLFRYNIETLVVLIKHEYYSFYPYIFEQLCNYGQYINFTNYNEQSDTKLPSPTICTNIKLLFNITKEMVLNNMAIELIEQGKTHILQSIYDYVNKNYRKYTDDHINNFMLCHNELFTEHFNKMSTIMKNECVTYLLHTNNNKILSKVICNKDITLKFYQNIDILIKSEMYYESLDYILNCNPPKYLHFFENVYPMILNIHKLITHFNDLNISTLIYNNLKHIHISEQIINLIKQNKLDAIKKICRYIQTNIYLLTREGIDKFVAIYKQNFSKINFSCHYNTELECCRVTHILHNNLIEPKKDQAQSITIYSNSNNDTDFNTTTHELINKYCFDYILIIMNNIGACYNHDLINHFNKLSFDQKDGVIEYLLNSSITVDYHKHKKFHHNSDTIATNYDIPEKKLCSSLKDELQILSDIVSNTDIIIDSNLKMEILLKSQRYNELFDYICTLTNDYTDNYHTLERLYKEAEDLRNLKINGFFNKLAKYYLIDGEIQAKSQDISENKLIFAIKNKKDFINVHPLLNFIYQNKNVHDIMIFFKITFPKMTTYDKIFIINSLPKTSDNFYELFVKLCDLLVDQEVEEEIAYHKMLQHIKNKPSIDTNSVITGISPKYPTIYDKIYKDPTILRGHKTRTPLIIHDDISDEYRCNTEPIDIIDYNVQDTEPIITDSNIKEPIKYNDIFEQVDVNDTYDDIPELDQYVNDLAKPTKYYNDCIPNHLTECDSDNGIECGGDICDNGDDIKDNDNTTEPCPYMKYASCRTKNMNYMDEFTRVMVSIFSKDTNSTPMIIEPDQEPEKIIINELIPIDKQLITHNVYTKLSQDLNIIEFVNTYDLSHHLPQFTNKYYKNFLIKNIVIQNVLNTNSNTNIDNTNYKMVNVTPNIYKKNCKNISTILNYCVADHKMLITLYNYTKTIPHCLHISIKEVQTFLSSIQDKLTDNDIFNNFSFKQNYDDKTNYLLDYFIMNNMPTCLNALFLYNTHINYDDDHVKMASHLSILNILIKNKARYVRPFVNIVSIED